MPTNDEKDLRAKMNNGLAKFFPPVRMDGVNASGEIDKDSFCGGLNIQKRELYVKGILAQDLGFVWGPSQRGFGGFSG